MYKVFLGGTCNESEWRHKIIPMLEIDYFNPVVPDWTPACMEAEKRQRVKCDFCLYTITPKMTGVYSIAEVVDDSNKRPEKTILVLLRKDVSDYFSNSQWKSLKAIASMVRSNGGHIFDTLEKAALYMNQKKEMGIKNLKACWEDEKRWAKEMNRSFYQKIYIPLEKD